MNPARCDRHSPLTRLALLTPLPPVVLALALVTQAPLSGAGKATLVSVTLAAWLWSALVLRAHLRRTLTTISSLLTALRQGDFSVRGHRRGGDALGAVLGEINGLADTLARERSRALEATALLGKVITELDVAVLAFDQAHRLKLANRAGERLFGAGALPLGAPAAALGLSQLLEGTTPRTVELEAAGPSGQWQLERSSFRLEGLPHELVVLTDLRRALREEERQAWRRLIAVLGHELNNSLAPVRSIVTDLIGALDRPASERPLDFEEDLARGLAVIDRRSAALERFMTSYARLAKLPPPARDAVEVGPWIRRTLEIEQRQAVRLVEGPELTLWGDGDQLDQLLINLVRNAVDAALETGGAAELRWRKLNGHLEIVVADEGPGVADTRNLFVPFFTTKPGGTGIGLVLSRQITEAHGGALTLESRRDRRGAIARLLLPL